MVEKVSPVPIAGLPPVAIQLNEYGKVPLVALAVQVTGLPAVADPQDAVKTGATFVGSSVILWRAWLGWLLIIALPMTSLADPVAPGVSTTRKVTSNVPVKV